MFLDYRLCLISCFFVLFNIDAFAQNTPKDIKQSQDVFIPITTDAYTDSLYFQNLEKSRLETIRLNNPPIMENPIPMGLEERIKNYEFIRGKYLKNSKEYLDIQVKIERLNKELDNKDPNE